MGLFFSYPLGIPFLTGWSKAVNSGDFDLIAFPVELWEGNILEGLVSNFGHLLKIDEQTTNLS